MKAEAEGRRVQAIPIELQISALQALSSWAWTYMNGLGDDGEKKQWDHPKQIEERFNVQDADNYINIYSYIKNYPKLSGLKQQ